MSEIKEQWDKTSEKNKWMGEFPEGCLLDDSFKEFIRRITPKHAKSPCPFCRVIICPFKRRVLGG